jgi:hypothetical protein
MGTLTADDRKISAGEYVDLESLLNTPQNNTGANQALAINQEQLVLQPKQKTKNTIEEVVSLYRINSEDDDGKYFSINDQLLKVRYTGEWSDL